MEYKKHETLHDTSINLFFNLFFPMCHTKATSHMCVRALAIAQESERKSKCVLCSDNGNEINHIHEKKYHSAVEHKLVVCILMVLRDFQSRWWRVIIKAHIFSNDYVCSPLS